MALGHRLLLALSLTTPLLAADVPTFEKTVQPVLTTTCSPCHNDQLASGGLNIAAFAKPGSIAESREGWERILQKLRAGEMPPKGIPRPPQLDAVIQYLQAEFDKADRNEKPDPGRVTARRLNRSEYSNTIRDLLAVDFHAEKSFPTDDLGNGFDNIGDVLTVSPVLMEKYMAAAESIAARAIGADPLPKPIEVQYHAKDKRIRRVDPSTIEASHRIDFDGEYLVRFGLPGERAADAKPVVMGFWMDGKLLQTMPVETKPSGLVYFNPYSEEQMRLVLPEGDHVFRAGFIDDPFVKDLTAKDYYNNKKNKFFDSITFVGPYPSRWKKPAARKSSPAIRSPAPPASTRFSPRSLTMPTAAPSPGPRSPHSRNSWPWPRPTASPPSREFNSPSRPCWCRPISCSASSTIRFPPTPPKSTRSPTSNWPRV